MGFKVLSDVSYREVASKAAKAGSATFAGEQRRREGKGLHPLVDPSGYDLIRRSISRKNPLKDKFLLSCGIAILEESRLDTTGSMGGNVAVAMRVLPKTYDLLATGKNAVLARYDTQMITSIFGDVCDDYVLCRSQAEMDEKIAEQMTLMVPEGGGGDSDEDPQYGLFGGAFLTAAEINQYGLKYYDFTVSDACGRHRIDPRQLIRVFGDEVFEKVAENGFQIDAQHIPDTTEVVAELKKRAHAFFLQVGHNPTTAHFWTQVYGKENVIFIPQTELLPQVKAAVIGLTEGVLDLQSVGEFLQSTGLDRTVATSITRAVAGIPIGAQKALPNFDKIPLKGALFAKKGDLWPIDPAHVADTETEAEDGSGGETDGSIWL